MGLFKIFYGVCLWVITYIYKLLEFIDIGTQSFIGTVLLQYISLFIIIAVFLGGIQLSISEIRARVVRPLYEKNIRNKSLKRIWLTSELYYLIDKFLFIISPKFLKFSPYTNNSFDKINTYSLLRWYESLKSFILRMFSFSVDNVVIWVLIVSYYNSNIILTVIYFFSWNNILSFFTNLDFKTINAITSFATFILSFVILFLLRVPFLKAKAKKKIYDEKYEKSINYQMENILNLAKCLIHSQENIVKLQHQIENITNNFSAEISQQNKYVIHQDKLIKDKYYWTSIPYNGEELFNDYFSYNKELENIEENLNLIKENLVDDAYRELNKSLFYEFVNLRLSSTGSFIGYYLLNREFLIGFYDESLKKNKLLIETFSLIKQVEDGMLSEEKFLEKYNPFSSYTYKKIIEQKEKELEEKIFEFRRDLRNRLEESIYYYIVTREYVNKSSYKSRLSIKDWLFSK
ncbi:hypothetical protein Q3A90_10990 [Priestia megaterium]|uniref:hypothetical protein n=1 Tax=Priestia megaterium TaxID=1404 RepID=UPI002675693E|nr:hypothetical protein [Priestia megaterium]WKU25352.1 hypothetical protein Q3A90_10990 [Priestia megaterium]